MPPINRESHCFPMVLMLDKVGERNCTVTRNLSEMLPHTLRRCKSISLTSGVGIVSTMLANGDWLTPFFPLSQSGADPRRCFNHPWYGAAVQHAPLRPSPAGSLIHCPDFVFTTLFTLLFNDSETYLCEQNNNCQHIFACLV